MKPHITSTGEVADRRFLLEGVVTRNAHQCSNMCHECGSSVRLARKSFPS
jgi:hypothetical protein